MNSVLGIIASNHVSNLGIAFSFPMALLATSSSMFVGGLFLVKVPRDDEELIVFTEGFDQVPENLSGPRFSNDVRTNQIEEAPLIPKKRPPKEPDVGGWGLFKDRDALLFIITMALLAGTALMYINNVGDVIKHLYYNSHSPDSNAPGDLLGEEYQSRMKQEIQELQNLHTVQDSHKNE
ncbi:10236_t:CDS:2 [Acaulospora colombiana]|uniref:10236_t:CDS:1 n=1 Tax=Acaulospora colombiana TaxID=27376 RepID=A0ACA9KG73_9GLOM|nr:10236_t:CDS:2 [Acaulospora colombiana]